MSEISTEFLERCIITLEKSYELLMKSEEGSIDYEMYRNALVKTFEMTLEQSGKLLRKKITPYFPTKKSADTLVFKDLFRSAARYGLLSQDEVERWLKCRDNRNNTAHDYGQKFAQETLSFIKDFIEDAKNLKKVIDNKSLKKLRSIIKKLYPKAIIWAYGSRVGYDANNVHNGSDLDLAIKDFGQDNHNIFELREAFQESNIPFLIDVLDFNSLPSNFKKEIEKNIL